ncbi:MAG TPA: iron ABC transporter permease [Fibrobacteria bacterium]|nr:iron ABC transporter permease [Fibrobacteria bacterium]
MNRREALGLVAIAALLAAAVAIALGSGRYPLGPGQAVAAARLWVSDPAAAASDPVAVVLFSLRLPRLAGGMLVGAALAASGACYQGIFRNPMADPGLLGVSTGAACGAAAGLLWADSLRTIQILSIAGGLAAILATLGLWKLLREEGDGTVSLILCGIVVHSTGTALLSLAKYVADPYSKLPALTNWLMGGFSALGADEIWRVAWMAPPALAGLWLVRGDVDILALGDDDARSLGVRPAISRLVAIVASTILVSMAVSLAGILAWVGVLVPHAARFALGPRFSVLLPGCILAGAAFLVLADTSCRTLFALEIPLGIATSLAGAPVFAILMKRSRRRWA